MRSGFIKNQKGFTLLLAILLSGVIIAISLSIINITLKQLVFSNMGRESEIAFYAADAGLECALYWDVSRSGKKFDSASMPSIDCMGGAVERGSVTGSVSAGNSRKYTFEKNWGTEQALCSKMTVEKFTGPHSMGTDNPNTCPAGATCTQIESRGYNTACSALTAPKVVERALRATY